jgi:hypothetical protein
MIRRALLLPCVLLAIPGLAGCFAPKLEPGFSCGDDPPGPQCPGGFFCDTVTYTCLRNGTSPTPGSVSLGLMQHGLEAARLGDDVVIAGWAFDSDSSATTFQIRTHDKTGQLVAGPFNIAEFSDVDQASLRSAGSDDAVALVGQKLTGELQIAWVTASGVSPLTTDAAYEAFAVTGSDQFVCYVGGRTPTAGRSVMDVGCNNGVPTSTFSITAGNRRGFVGLAAGVADDYTKIVVVADVPPQLAAGPHDLFAFCPDQPAPTLPFAQNLPEGDSLKPRVFYSPLDSLVQVGWKTDSALRTGTLDWPACTSFGRENMVGASVATAFAMAGRARSTGWTQSAGVWSLDMHGNDSPPQPSIANWVTGGGTQFSVGHKLLTNPHALTTKDNELWFFFHAADDVPSQGYLKYTSLASMGADVRYLETDLVTADYAVARRNAGTFFLVFRVDPSGDGGLRPLDAFLAIFDANGDLVAPLRSD